MVVTRKMDRDSQGPETASSGVPLNLPRHEVWRLQYRQKRYLTHAKDEALDQRLEDVINNLTTLTDEGEIGALPVTPAGEYWMRLFTHLLEEYETRERMPPRAPDAPFPKATAPNVPRAVAALSKVDVPSPGRSLIKFGKQQHMRDLYEAGRIRIAPAREYSDPSLNHAMKDEELKFEQILPETEVTLVAQDKETGTPIEIKVFGELTSKIELETNCYIYCMTHTMNHRLFDDFEADSCVIIRDMPGFAGLLSKAVEAELPGWRGWRKPVEYVDPYNRPKKIDDVIFSKHFRFWYQQEFRFAWLPDANREMRYEYLEPFFVELGALNHIGELVSLR